MLREYAFCESWTRWSLPRALRSRYCECEIIRRRLHPSTHSHNLNLGSAGEDLSGFAKDIRKEYDEMAKNNFEFKSRAEQTGAINNVFGVGARTVQSTNPA